VETLGQLVEGTLVIELFLWYIIAGVLLAAWATLYLAFAAFKRNVIVFRIVGVILALCVIWLGVVAAYEYSYGFTDAIRIPSLIVPVAMLLAQLAICIILVVFRRKER